MIISITLIRIINFKKRSNMNYYIFLVTVPNIEESKKIGKLLIENKLVACVNIIQNVYSIYKWKEEVVEDNEHLLLIKTTEENSEQLIQKINEIHGYETPECIGFKINKGSKDYLKWLSDVIE